MVFKKMHSKGKIESYFDYQYDPTFLLYFNCRNHAQTFIYTILGGINLIEIDDFTMTNEIEY